MNATLGTTRELARIGVVAPVANSNLEPDLMLLRENFRAAGARA